MDMTTTDAWRWLEGWGACDLGLAYARGRRGPADAWRNCRRLAWIFWVLRRATVDRRLLLDAACRCIRLAEPGLPRTAAGRAARRALAAAEAFAAGRPDRGRLGRAGEAARVAKVAAMGVGVDYHAAYAGDRLVDAAGEEDDHLAALKAEAAISCAHRAAAFVGDAVDWDAAAAADRRAARVLVATIPYAVVARAAGLGVRGPREKKGA